MMKRKSYFTKGIAQLLEPMNNPIKIPFKMSRRPIFSCLKWRRLFQISLFCITLLSALEKVFSQDWLSEDMRSINPDEMLSASEKYAYEEAENAMIAFYFGRCTYDHYRSKVKIFAEKGFSYRKNAALVELQQIDAFGKENLETARDNAIEKINKEALKRDITPGQFWSLQVLYGENNLDGDDWDSRASSIEFGTDSTDRHMRLRIGAAGESLGLFNGKNRITYLNSNKPLVRYWRRVYDGVSKKMAETLKSQEEYNEEIIRNTESMQQNIYNLNQEIQKLNRSY